MKKLADEINPEFPFVIYKEPASSLLHIIQQKNKHLYTDETIKTPGYYFYPFQKEKDPAVVFPEDQSNEKTFLYRKFVTEGAKNELVFPETTSLKKKHIEKVEEAIEKIKQDSSLQKIIISSAFPIYVNHFDWERSLLTLMKSYDESMVWMWHHPAVGTWMGATPELLASFNEGKLETMALAGTLPVQPDEALVWTGKEIREQQLVTDFIVSTIKNYTEKISVKPPKTVYQGKIAHIQTQIYARIEEEDKENILLDLHPTPAVSGLPVAQAIQNIKKIEKESRIYYTGFLGMKKKNEYKFFVILRTMQIKTDELIIYAGGGILSDSIAEKEWEEVKNKVDILYKIIRMA